MAKCGLSIELERPDAIYHSGETVRGHVQIHADADIRCRALVVYTGWRTRGMGNVSSQSGPQVSVFSGELTAGESQRFPFELQTLHWPPSYDGFQLSVEHFVEATVDLPWASDPKTSVPIHVVPSDVQPADVQLPRPPAKVLQVFVFAIVALFLIIFAVSFFGPQPWVLIGAPALLLLAALVLLLVFKWLPQLYLGEVRFDVQPKRLSPGELLSGSFSLRPSRTIHPRFIHFRLTASEVCVSGTGTNQKTHRHELFNRLVVLADQPMLPADEVTHFELRTRLPPIAAYSLKLSDNELHWIAQIHVGIAGLVDWKEQIFLTVVPPRDAGLAASLVPGIQASQFTAEEPIGLTAEHATAQPEPSITFAETLQHIRSVREQPEQVELLVAAVAGLPLAFAARIDRRLLRAGTEDLQIAADEQVFWAEHEDPPLPLTLYVPQPLADDVHRASGRVWTGQGEVVGWEQRGSRLQVRVLA